MSNLITRAATGAFEWLNARAPGLMPMYRKHMSEYYAPKNFNFWYYMGSLALLVLVNQIVTGIFLTMNYKTSAAEAFASIEYIMRDESQHLNFGINLVNTIKEEQPEVWTQEFQDHIVDLVKRGTELECEFAATAFPKGIFGMSSESFREYIQHIADRRLQSIGLKPVYGSKNPFPWMSESMDLKKEKNFFETRVIEYQSGGGLSWE